ncbi:hypothetical protein C2E23DRAFT_575368 [Lenzites betulinus]|nr:hypothetical protein C2E23DRAFT_575368 [Lenzites betulinus]
MAATTPIGSACELSVVDHHMLSESSNKFHVGEVFQNRDTVRRTIEEIFASQCLPRLSRGQRRRAHAKSIGPRPCIVIEEPHRSPDSVTVTPPQICLMATFGGTPMEDLPRVFQFFCIPVMTLCGRPLEGAHAPSLPEWTRPNAHVIAWPYLAQRPLGRRWRLPKGYRGDGSDTDFGEIAMQTLKDMCAQKKRDWEQCCLEDPGLAAEYEREFRVSPSAR